MISAIRIASATREDIPVLRRLAIDVQVKTFGPHNTEENMRKFLEETYSVEQFERELTEAGAHYYLAWSGDALAGFIRLRLNNEAEHLLGANAIELQRIYVATEFQGQKIGKLLMEKAFEHARAGKFEWLWLGVWEKNVKAQEIYAKWGFTRFSEHIFWMGDDPQTDWLLKVKV